jgi:hypothetical protein
MDEIPEEVMDFTGLDQGLANLYGVDSGKSVTPGTHEDSSKQLDEQLPSGNFNSSAVQQPAQLHFSQLPQQNDTKDDLQSSGTSQDNPLRFEDEDPDEGKPLIRPNRKLFGSCCLV